MVKLTHPRSHILSAGSVDDLDDNPNAECFINHYLWEHRAFELYRSADGDMDFDSDEH